MAKSKGITGKGTTIGFCEDDPAVTYTNIAEIVGKPTGPDRTVKKVDLTHSESPDDTEECTSGMISIGELSFDINYEPEQRDTLDGLIRKVVSFQVTYPDEATDTFPGYISKMGQETPVDGSAAIHNKIAVQPTGTVVYAKPTPPPEG